MYYKKRLQRLQRLQNEALPEVDGTKKRLQKRLQTLKKRLQAVTKLQGKRR